MTLLTNPKESTGTSTIAAVSRPQSSLESQDVSLVQRVLVLSWAVIKSIHLALDVLLTAEYVGTHRLPEMDKISLWKIKQSQVTSMKKSKTCGSRQTMRIWR